MSPCLSAARRFTASDYNFEDATGGIRCQLPTYAKSRKLDE